MKLRAVLAVANVSSQGSHARQSNNSPSQILQLEDNVSASSIQEALVPHRLCHNAAEKRSPCSSHCDA
uniref:Secreted protein n=1 Tax=Loa loa TaxID=7209 RepID=A0A1I7VYV7_LOALO